jgi:hypothetical protein
LKKSRRRIKEAYQEGFQDGFEYGTGKPSPYFSGAKGDAERKNAEEVD